MKSKHLKAAFLCTTLVCSSNALATMSKGEGVDVMDVSVMFPLDKTHAPYPNMNIPNPGGGNSGLITPSIFKDITDRVTRTTTEQQKAVEAKRLGITVDKLSAAQIARIETNIKLLDGADNLANWHVYSFRYDPCAPTADLDAHFHKAGGDDKAEPTFFQKLLFGTGGFKKNFVQEAVCTHQVRLIVQPNNVIAPNAAGKPSPFNGTPQDFAMHLVYNVGSGTLAANDPVFLDLLKIKELSSARADVVDTSGRTLGVHIGLKKELDAGTSSDGPVAAAVRTFVTKYAQPKNLLGIAFFGLAPKPQPWVFISGAVVFKNNAFHWDVARVPADGFASNTMAASFNAAGKKALMEKFKAGMTLNDSLLAGFNFSEFLKFGLGITDAKGTTGLATFPTPLDSDFLETQLGIASNTSASNNGGRILNLGDNQDPHFHPTERLFRDNLRPFGSDIDGEIKDLQDTINTPEDPTDDADTKAQTAADNAKSAALIAATKACASPQKQQCDVGLRNPTVDEAKIAFQVDHPGRYNSNLLERDCVSCHTGGNRIQTLKLPAMFETMYLPPSGVTGFVKRSVFQGGTSAQPSTWSLRNFGYFTVGAGNPVPVVASRAINESSAVAHLINTTLGLKPSGVDCGQGDQALKSDGVLKAYSCFLGVAERAGDPIPSTKGEAGECFKLAGCTVPKHLIGLPESDL